MGVREEQLGYSSGVSVVDRTGPMDYEAALAVVERALADASVSEDLGPEGLAEAGLAPSPELEHRVLSALRANRGSHLGKRALDVLLAGLGLIVVAPLLLVIALAVKLSSGSPILLVQERLGQNRKPFSCFKFRTMVQAEDSPARPIWTTRNDPRVTSVGRFLRPRGLDELPQLINILRGDMSLVGPRPFRTEVSHLMAPYVPFYNVRFLVKPGLVGWAQIKYRNSSTISEQVTKCSYDFYYIRNQSVALDFYIILRSTVIPFKKSEECGPIVRLAESMLIRLERRMLQFSGEN